MNILFVFNHSIPRCIIRDLECMQRDKPVLPIVSLQNKYRSPTAEDIFVKGY